MAIKCQKCGHEIDGNSPVCMYCGAPIPDADLTPEAKKRIEAEKVDTHVASDASSLKAFGAGLLIIGGIIDVISMFMIYSSDVESFQFVTIAGTICFLVGLFLFSNG